MAISLSGTAQQQKNTRVTVQREAMHKLAFLVGKWQGPATVMRRQGEPLHLTQTEDVQWKLDGLVLLIDGESKNAGGKVGFSALATVAYDDAAKTYKIRAYHDGQYLDTEFTLKDGGFSWGFPAGPGRVENTMRLTAKGEWNEVTEFVTGSNPPQRSMEMELTRRP